MPADKPVPPLPTVTQVPLELLSLRRWCGWRALWDESKGKWLKPPCSPLTGEKVGPVAKNEKHFLTFEEALAGVKKNELDGVGFVFVKADGFVGIDLDDCLSEGVLKPEASTWLPWLPTYAELSPSGKGIHFIGRGKLNRALGATPLAKNGSTAEAYGWERYFTFTGARFGDAPLVIADIQVGTDKLLNHLGAKPEPPAPDVEARRPMTAFTVRKLHEANLKALRNAAMGEGNALLNTTAFFAARAFTGGGLDGTEVAIKQQLLDIVTREWTRPHPVDGARETINSGWTSGAAQPLVVREDDWPQVAETIESFNERFYVIENYGGRTRVAWEELSRISKGESFLLVTQSFVDFRNRYMHQLIQVGEKDDGEPRWEDVANVWLKSRYRAQFEKVVFEPNVTTPEHIRNLWRGFAYEPKKGDCSLYLAHLKDNICQGNAAKYDYLIGWMAYAVRHPAEQGHVAIVVQGLKGVGKNVFAESFANLWGQHGMVVSDQSRITKNFNAHLRDKCVLICDEAFFAGDRRHEGVLKALITGSTLTIEAKGVDAVTVPNLLHLVIIGNDAWLVPASWEERRFLMLNCGARQQQNQEYFKAINHQLNHGGYSALLHYLLYEADLGKFNVREAPHTDELREQMGESLRGVEAAYHECLYTGLIPGKISGDGTAQVRTADFIEWARKKERGWSNLRPQHVGMLFGLNPRGTKLGFNFGKAQSKSNSERQRYWVIPELSEARKMWDEFRFKVLWPEDGGEWDTLAEEETGFR